MPVETLTLFEETTYQLKRPLLKWAGGKTQLLPVLHKAKPKAFLRYAELFFGGGAFFWSLAHPGSLLADSNPDLVNFYKVVRDQPSDLLALTAQLPITRDDYYRIRAQRTDDLSPVENAARFAYLNKTCFNGLYRVNRHGDFNTPFGGKPDTIILDAPNTYAASLLLRRSEIICADFTESFALLKEGDFVYLDPPYLPIGAFSDFRRYTKVFFDEAHHIRLAAEFSKLKARGVMALLSNSASEKIRCLYKGYYCVTVMASRHINCNGNGRSKIPELLVANYPLELGDAFS